MTYLTCVICKSLHRFIPTTYDVGWLLTDRDEYPCILFWGNTKNKDTARLLAKDLIARQGERLVLLYDKKPEAERYDNTNLYRISVLELDNILSGKDTEVLHRPPKE